MMMLVATIAALPIAVIQSFKTQTAMLSMKHAMTEIMMRMTAVLIVSMNIVAMAFNNQMNSAKMVTSRTVMAAQNSAK